VNPARYYTKIKHICKFFLFYPAPASRGGAYKPGSDIRLPVYIGHDVVQRTADGDQVGDLRPPRNGF
jgi:hypothetical protein